MEALARSHSWHNNDLFDLGVNLILADWANLLSYQRAMARLIKVCKVRNKTEYSRHTSEASTLNQLRAAKHQECRPIWSISLETNSIITIIITITHNNEISAWRVRKHCTLAVVRRIQKISPRHRPLPGGTGWPKFNQLEMITTFIYRPSLVRIDACNFELSW